MHQSISATRKEQTKSPHKVTNRNFLKVETLYHCQSLTLSYWFSFSLCSVLLWTTIISVPPATPLKEGTSAPSVNRLRTRCTCSRKETGGSVSVRRKQFNRWCVTETWQNRTCLHPVAAEISSNPQCMMNGWMDSWMDGWMCSRLK